MSLPATLLLLAAALVVDGLLSATRAALMNSHAPSLRALDERGVRGAGRALRLSTDAIVLLLSFGAVQNLARLTTVGLSVFGWALVDPRRSGGSLAATLAIAAMGVLLIELLGESLARRAAERWAVALSWLGAVVVMLAWPVRSLRQRLAPGLPGRLGLVRPLVTEEEIKTIVDAGEEGGAIEVEEKKMIFSIFELGDTLVREVMVPRIDICAFDERQTLDHVADVLLEAGHSRAPVYRGNIDKVVGIVYVKDLLRALRQGRQAEPVSAILRPALFVPEAKKADELLAELQARRIHMAVVVDEYGGTAGLVTLEDLVEEIVGEIRDEYDATEEAAFQVVHDGEFLFSGRIDLDEVNELTGARLPKEISDTLGGFVSGRLGRVPSPGDVVEAGGLRLVVEQSSGRSILKVRARRTEDERNGEDG